MDDKHPTTETQSSTSRVQQDSDPKDSVNSRLTKLIDQYYKHGSLIRDFLSNQSYEVDEQGRLNLSSEPLISLVEQQRYQDLVAARSAHIIALTTIANPRFPPGLKEDLLALFALAIRLEERGAKNEYPTFPVISPKWVLCLKDKLTDTPHAHQVAPHLGESSQAPSRTESGLKVEPHGE